MSSIVIIYCQSTHNDVTGWADYVKNG